MLITSYFIAAAVLFVGLVVRLETVMRMRSRSAVPIPVRPVMRRGNRRIS
jgi:hypothetical protein